MVPNPDDQEVGVMTTVSALVSGLDAELRRLGYEDSTMKWYRGAWRRMGRYFAARGGQEFSLAGALARVSETCGSFARQQTCARTQPAGLFSRGAPSLETH